MQIPPLALAAGEEATRAHQSPAEDRDEVYRETLTAAAKGRLWDGQCGRCTGIIPVFDLFLIKFEWYWYWNLKVVLEVF